MGERVSHRRRVLADRSWKVQSGSPNASAVGANSSKSATGTASRAGVPKEGWVFPTESKSGHLEQGSAKNQHEAAFKSIEKAAKEECKKAGRDESEAKI